MPKIGGGYLGTGDSPKIRLGAAEWGEQETGLAKSLAPPSSDGVCVRKVGDTFKLAPISTIRGNSP